MPFLTIKLDDKQSTQYHGDNIDAIVAQRDIVTAVEELDRTFLALNVLENTISTVEDASATGKALAEKDRTLAYIATVERIHDAFKLTGNTDILAHYVSTTEDSSDLELFVGTIEENILTKMWEKTKEYAKKAYEWIRTLIKKVMDFLKDLVGKSGTTADNLLDLLNDLKKDGKTKLKESSFSDPVKNRLIKLNPVIAVTEGTIGGGKLESFIDKMGEVYNSAVDGKTLKTDELTNELDKIKSIVESGKISGNDLKDIVNSYMGYINNIFGQEIIEEPRFGKDIFEAVKTYVEDELNDKDYYYGMVSGLTEKDVHFTVMIGNEKANDVYNEIKSKVGNIAELNDDEVEELARKLTDLNSNISIKSIKVNIPDKDVERLDVDVVPLDFTDAYSLAKKMKNYAKKATSDTDRLLRSVDKAEKVFDKVLTTLSTKSIDLIKGSKKGSGDADGSVKNISKVVRVVTDKLIKLQLETLRSKAKGVAATGTALGRNNIGEIVKESARLYTK